MKKILTIALAFLLMMSNMGFTVATHFCGGHAVKSGLRLGGGDWDCGMNTKSAEYQVSQTNCTSITAEPCCENMHQHIQTDDNQPTDLPAPQFHAPIGEPVVFSFLYLESSTAQEIAPRRIDPPPLLKRDVQVLFQTFLI
ncbi:hypothetical protein [Persicitalea sp.]|uniref:HYC_CC_PP family protein n=1 Tax=Persicitalea sp. TaxID=3100273 RepID=UPI0035945886